MLSPVRVPTLFPNENITSRPTYSNDFPLQVFQANPISIPLVPRPQQIEIKQSLPGLSTFVTSRPMISTVMPSPINSPKAMISYPNISNPVNNRPITSLPVISNPTVSIPTVPRPGISNPKVNNKQFTPKVLIQSIPITNKRVETQEELIAGPIGIGQYKSDELITVSEPNISSDVNNDAQTLRVINSVPSIQSLPAFIYQRDSTTGQLTRYLALETDKSYDTDPDYGINQEWLLFQRQGDQYDRTAEWNKYPEITDAEEFNILGVTTLNEGRIWNGPPRTIPVPRSEYYDEYKRYLEYSQTQIQEEDDD